MASAFILICLAVSLKTASGVYADAERSVCDLIEKNYYRSHDSSVREFIKYCLEDAGQSPMSLDRNTIVRRINRRLSALKTSHLFLFTPSENEWIWESHGLDTGIRSRMIEGYLIVYKVLPGSPAEKSGLKIGDEITALNGEQIASHYDAQSGRGIFSILRGTEALEFLIEPVELTEDLSPQLHSLSGGYGHLKIASFLPQYFEDEAWKKIASSLSLYKSLVIDLRDNAGGSFPAMLRGLSPFLCEDRLVGQIYRAPQRVNSSMSKRGLSTDPSADLVSDLANELSAESQLKQLKSAQALNLKTFEGYGCYKGRVTVLIDSGTSSVAEIFAHAFRSRPDSRIWGQPSAGEVVMAQWFDLPSLGRGYALSIPIAGYRAKSGEAIESEGLFPEKALYYDLEQARKGVDSWVHAVVSGVSL